jgi:D-lactate dehydrogenase
MKLAFFEVDSLDQKIYINAFPQDEVIFFDGELINNVPLAARDADVISIFVCSRITAEVLKQFSRLKFIAQRATGYDNIDIDAAIKYGIQVASVPDYAVQTVAEYVFALLLCLSRKIYDAYYRLRHEHYFSHKNLQGFDLYKKKLGVVGTGNIGKKVIGIAQGFEMEVIAYDIFPDHKYAHLMKFSYCSFEDLLSQSDIITFHVPLNKVTHYMLNKKNISLVKKGAYIINTARGGVIETDALVEALDKNIIAGAALDVLEEECFTRDPLSLLIDNSPEKNELKAVLENHYLINHPKVIVTPHNAFNSYEAMRRLIFNTIENIIAWQKGKPINLVLKR